MLYFFTLGGEITEVIGEGNSLRWDWGFRRGTDPLPLLGEVIEGT